MSTSPFYALSLPQRLEKAGITNAFSDARRAKNAARMSSLLRSVEYSHAAANATVNTFLKDK